ncbi:hypothetical protein L6R52_15905 [Myxococcota bacterium]|nr:hypothetical protein [Myxococcota bacterium]
MVRALRQGPLAVSFLTMLLGAAACSDPGTVSGGACVTNQNCPTGEQCIGGRCVASNSGGCKNDDACPLGEYCNLETKACEAIQVTGCSTDDACPPDQRCNTLTGVCINGRRSCTGDAQCTPIGKHCDLTLQQCVDCVLTADCQSPEICMSGSCVDPSTTQCTDDSGCNAPASVCVGGQCVDGCQRPGSPVTCGLGELCDSSTGRCRAGQVTCSTDQSCNPPSTICESGQCIPGCTQLGGLQCTGGNVCDAQSGRCEAPSGSCATDAQCGAPAGVCEGGQCIGGCGQIGGLTCGGGTVCDSSSGRCVNVQGPCSTDAQCGPPTGVCEGGQCIPGCTQLGGLQCVGNTVCNGGTGRCDPGGAVCTSDAQCTPPSTICNTTTGACVAGCSVTGCPSGQTCGTNGRCTGNPNPGTGAALNATCAANADCASSTCFDFGGGLGARCVSSCGNSGDCPSGFTCYDYNGAKMCISSQLFSGATFSTPVGGACSVGGDCRSNFCPGGSCIDTCSESNDCSGLSCQWSEFAADLYIGSCQGPAGVGANGASCAADSDCRSGVCYGSGTCGDLCGSTADCPNGNVCALVNYSICQIDVGLCFGWAPNFVKACVDSPHGNGGVGAACSIADQCRSGLCFTTVGECTDACSRDADCPSTHVCGVEQYGSLPEGVSDEVPVYINICKRRGT